MRIALHALGALAVLLAPLAAFAVAEAPPVAGGAPEPVPDRIVSPAPIGDVDFPHRAHVEDYGFACSECHHETRAAALATPHPQYLEDSGVDCAVCHGQSTPLAARACSACHGSTIETVASDSLSAKVAVHRTCWRCHESSTGVAASAGCALCHHPSATGAGTGAAPAAARGR